jgi:Tol biopolymer transport system component
MTQMWKFLPDDGGSYDLNHSDIYTMNLDGTGLRALTHTRPGWSSSQPAWGPAPS